MPPSVMYRADKAAPTAASGKTAMDSSNAIIGAIYHSGVAHEHGRCWLCIFLVLYLNVHEIDDRLLGLARIS
jgi:hypothetical protein